MSHKLRKIAKNGKSTKHCKTQGFLAGGRGRRQGARPLSPTERRETPSARTRPGGPWPDLSAYARQPATGPTMLAHLVVCWPMLASYSPMLSQKIRKMGTAKKHCKTQDSLMVGGHLGATLAHRGAMLAYLEGNVGPSRGYVDPSWGYVGPS